MPTGDRATREGAGIGGAIVGVGSDRDVESKCKRGARTTMALLVQVSRWARRLARPRPDSGNVDALRKWCVIDAALLAASLLVQTSVKHAPIMRASLYLYAVAPLDADSNFSSIH